ncbi:hypothetical protein [Rhizobium sp. Root1220]|uniref:hypothetical protein n=1 Tax=Rhizobium sp. Root1220 TaxID=1736432 RepID=UPI0006FE06E0|nr:hypothetical protein [Rhizobium sp. Root1220]KQV70216.1 hypothetical protein ASC90_08810 [Rhizobium sp. Root1220]
MNKIAKLALVAIASSIAFAGSSRAGSWGMNSGSSIERTIRSFSGNDFNVQYVYNWRHQADRTTGPWSVPQRSPTAIQHIQESIDSNRTLVQSLARKGVNVRNIVNANEALDGSLTFYVR